MMANSTLSLYNDTPIYNIIHINYVYELERKCINRYIEYV